jgi:hypothetical protein
MGFFPHDEIRWKVAMLFVAYWELNENLNPKDIAKLGAELVEKGLTPVEGVKQLGWYVTSSVPLWGVTINEADNAETIFKDMTVWTNAKPGFFKFLKIAPALTAQDAIRILMEM